MAEPCLSIIILSFEPHVSKGNCVRHCLHSILNQDFLNYEVILVENSRSKNDIPALEGFIESNNPKGIKVRILNLPISLSRGAARNSGVKLAIGQTLVFVDDDTIILRRDAFAIIAKQTISYEFGCGAKRYWTEKDWSRTAENTLNLMRHREMEFQPLKYNPPKFVRGSESILSEEITFIGNFGFCHRDSFNNANGFPDFSISCCEDDYLLFQLAMNSCKFCSLKDIDVLHVYHTIPESRSQEYLYYFTRLVALGYFEFDAVAYISNGNKFSEVVIKLNSIHYCSKIQRLYKEYCKQKPLNIDLNDNIRLSKWLNKQQLSLQDFAIALSHLFQSSNLNEFAQSTNVDFDNIAPLILVALQNGCITISEKGKISKHLEFSYSSIPSARTITRIQPDPTLNQFPCTEASLLKRLKFLKERYPFCDYLSIGIIGDDDLFSSVICDEYWLFPTIIEKDGRIIKAVTSLSERYVVRQTDLQNPNDVEKLLQLNKVNTFICDPPYTINGILLFIYSGLVMLNLDGDTREFYVIANRMMLGDGFYSINKILSQSGVFLHDCRQNMSHYEFPEHFSENTRAQYFFNSINLTKSVDVSSTSDLFIYRTTKPDLSLLKQKLDVTLIYNNLA